MRWIGTHHSYHPMPYLPSAYTSNTVNPRLFQTHVVTRLLWLSAPGINQIRSIPSSQPTNPQIITNSIRSLCLYHRNQYLTFNNLSNECMYGRKWPGNGWWIYFWDSRRTNVSIQTDRQTDKQTWSKNSNSTLSSILYVLCGVSNRLGT